MDVRVRTLKNGLTVYVTRNPEIPRFYTEIAVRAGSKHDPAQNTGLAHYLEHLLFKGSTRFGTQDYAREKPLLDRIRALYDQRFVSKDPAERKRLYDEINRLGLEAAKFAVPNELDTLYKALGGSHLNAHTSHEETVYKVGLPKNRLAQWARIEAERFRAPVMRLFLPELEVVYEEKNRSLDNKFQVISDAVDGLLYKKHPYGQQRTIGKVEHLKNPNIRTIEEFYARNYVPGNMAIFLSGDVDPDAAIATIEAAFSGWEARPVPPQPTFADPPPQGVERVTVTYPGEPFCLLAFRTASVRSKDADALKLVDMILDNATAGLINLNLNQAQKVRQAGSFPALHNEYGAQYMYAIPKEGQTLEEVEALLLEQVAHLKRGEFEDWVLPAIIRDYKIQQRQLLESNPGRVSLMREAFISFTPWQDKIGEIARMEKLTKADVVRVANAYFQGAYVAGYRKDGPHKVPTIDKPKIDTIPIDPTRRSAFVTEVLAMPAPPIEPVFIDAAKDFRHTQPRPGVDLYVAKNPVNDLFTLTLSVDIGSRQEPRLQVAAELLEKAGTGSLDGSGVKKRWYQLGTNFKMTVGANRTEIRMSGLDAAFGDSMALARDLLRQPSVEPAILAELVAIAKNRRQTSAKDQKTLLSALAAYNLYGKDSPFLTRLSSARLDRLTVPELAGVLGRLLKTRFTVAYTGSLPFDAVAAVVAKIPGPGALQAPPAYRELRIRRPKKTEILLFDHKMAQTLFRIDFEGGAASEAERARIDLFNSYFAGGMDAIVFQEMRESRALVYTAQAVYRVAERKGDHDAMIGFVGTQADKTPEALEVFLRLIDDPPRSTERFEAARAALLTRYRTQKVGFRAILDTVLAWRRQGLAPDPRRARFAATARTSLDAVLAFQKKRLRGHAKLLSLVGDASRMDLQRIGKVGVVRKLAVGDIFTM